MDEKIADKRLVCFNKECILAGSRQSVVNFLNLLIKLGVDVVKTASIPFPTRLSPRGINIVLLLQNKGESKKFPQVLVLSRSWWDYYHNPKKHKSIYKTYNIPRQWYKVYDEILKLEDVPLLFPE